MTKDEGFSNTTIFSAREELCSKLEKYLQSKFYAMLNIIFILKFCIGAISSRGIKSLKMRGVSKDVVFNIWQCFSGDLGIHKSGTSTDYYIVNYNIIKASKNLY